MDIALDNYLQPLERLPIEMLLRITRHLSTTDLCTVRLVSRTIERALFHSFSHEFFRRKQFMLTDFSLQALLDISQHPTLSQTLQHVSFGLDRFPNKLIEKFESEEKTVLFQIALGQQMSLTCTGRGVDMLAAAFANLPNLQTVDIRDFDSRTRFRDGPSRAWHSYGYATVGKEVGDGWLRHDVTFSSETFSIILAALAKANAVAGVRPSNLHVMLRARRFGLTARAFDLTVAPGTNPAPMLAVVSGLKQLQLDVNFHTDPNFNHVLSFLTGGTRYQPVSIASLPFHAFLAQAINVEWLRLNLQNCKMRRADVFISYLGKPLPDWYPFLTSPSASSSASSLFSPTPSPSVTLPPGLRRLELGHSELSVPYLLRLLRRIRLLNSLSLWNIALGDPDNTTYPPAIWTGFLEELALNPLANRLREISIDNPRQLSSVNASFSDPVLFDGATSCKHNAGQAEPMRAFLLKLAKTAKVEIPPADSDDEDEEGDSEDEEEEDEENDDGANHIDDNDNDDDNNDSDDD
ncbi:hypothetical protein HMPREF1624_02160 [Sporothrix schenckii ATCC 58251]|uniref:F-box domain-containing protein n=1 Tax=Sporothrix schenckii (strain ATCC 58251 / de Perez 2211183) TaxID=1391915 RepID=U7Q2K2_SPOS1|nr:hypothetical protein HMPREF1624_02160 [Sporothrix schenckii ATCC 58251]